MKSNAVNPVIEKKANDKFCVLVSDDRFLVHLTKVTHYLWSILKNRFSKQIYLVNFLP